MKYLDFERKVKLLVPYEDYQEYMCYLPTVQEACRSNFILALSLDIGLYKTLNIPEHICRLEERAFLEAIKKSNKS